MHALVSVIVPALNEAAGIEQTLRSVATQEADHEIIVVDGRSTDDTARIARRHARVIEAPPGRAQQMNAGAALARGHVLLFLHADTVLPPGGLEKVCTAMRSPACPGGIFRLRFDTPTPLLSFYSFCTRFALPKICFGDRACFVRCSVFDELGGFPDIPIFEDLELVRLLHERGDFAFLDEYVTTSARRYRQNGPLRQQLLNVRLWLQYRAGSDPRKLVKRYPTMRSPQPG